MFQLVAQNASLQPGFDVETETKTVKPPLTLLKIPEDRRPEGGSSCGSASCQQRKTRVTQNILLQRNRRSRAIIPRRSTRTGITYQARYVTRIRSWLTAGRNTHGSSTTKLPWNDHGCLLRTDLQTLMLEKPIYDVSRTRCPATTPARSSFYKYLSQRNSHT